MERKKIKSKHEYNPIGDSRIVWSSVPGVQKLELVKLHQFSTISRQLRNALTFDLGEQADFLIGVEELGPTRPDLLYIRRDFPHLSEDEARDIKFKVH